MKTRILGLVLLLAATTVLAQPAPPEGDGPWVVRATFQSRSQVDFLAAEIEPWEVHHDEGWLIVDVDRAGWQLLLDLGFEVEVDEVRTAKYRAPRVPLPDQVEAIPGYPCYRTVEETFAAALALVAAHPTLATWTDIGNSWEKSDGGGPPGYDIMVLKLTNAATPEPKPKVLMTGSIHAREYVTAELATRLAEHLLTNYGTDPDVTWFLDHQEVHLVLNMNPDGRKKAETGLSWRKNTDSDYCATPSSIGIDLNRNFPYNWGCCGGSSSVGCSETYRGPSAASEPEVQAVRDYEMAIFPDYGDPQIAPIPDTAAGIFIDLHSYGELVMWPWGYTSSPTLNATQLRTLGRKFAYFNGHTPQQANTLYATDGTTRDFAYGELGLPSYTFEFGTDFFQDCATFTSTILPTNLQALLYAIRVARLPYKLPAGPDALSVATTPSGNVPAGTDVLVTATINDTRYNNTNGTEPVQAIAAAEVYVDTPPWATGATPIALTATDGTFNATVEGVQGTLPTTGWTGTNPHTLYVRGRDAGNNWGPVSAVFVRLVGPGNETLTVSKPGTGSGTVTSSPAGIDCGATCAAPFLTDSVVVLQAAAAVGSTFTGWSGEGCSGTGTCQVVMDQARSVVATFTVNTYALTVAKTGTGSGTVTSDPAGIACGATCTASYPYATVVTLTPAAGVGSAFVSWSGACTGTGSCQVTMTQARSVTASFALRPAGTDTPGIYRASDRSWYLKNSNAPGAADLEFPYGDPSDQAVKGDWDGDGDDTVGIYRDGTFFLRNSNSAGPGEIVFPYGAVGDIPIAGDWDGDGIDTIGVYRPAEAAWYLKNTNAAGAPDVSFTYGLTNETPVAGDWDGNGTDTVGIFRASDRQWYLHNSNAGGNAELVFPYGDPAQDVPVVGDWDGDGDDTVGIYRTALGEWFLKNTNAAGNSDLNFVYGLVNEKPLAGDWDGN